MMKGEGRVVVVVIVARWRFVGVRASCAHARYHASTRVRKDAGPIRRGTDFRRYNVPFPAKLPPSSRFGHYTFVCPQKRLFLTDGPENLQATTADGLGLDLIKKISLANLVLFQERYA